MKSKTYLLMPVLYLVAMLLVPQSKLLASFRIEERATIPFDFYLGDTLLPAGNYAVERDEATLNLYGLQNNDRPVIAVSLFIPESSNVPLDSGKLVFHKYGDKYFLVQIWDPHLATEFVARTSTAEKNARKALEEVQTSSKVSPEEIVVALK